jgi:hypothetical protein
LVLSIAENWVSAARVAAIRDDDVDEDERLREVAVRRKRVRRIPKRRREVRLGGRCRGRTSNQQRSQKW